MKKVSLLILFILITSCTKAPMLSTAQNPEDGYAECHEYSKDKDYEEANQCFELLRSRFPGSVQAIEADIEIADNYFRQEDYLVAAEAYKNFVRIHPAYEKIDYVYYRTGQCYLKESPKSIARDQQYLDEAIHYFTLTMNYPGSEYQAIAREKWIEMRRRIAARSFYVGRFYYRTKEYYAAVPRFEEIVTKYTDLGFDEEALYYLGDSYHQLGQEDKALEIAAVFSQHFPDSQYRKRLAKKLSN